MQYEKLRRRNLLTYVDSVRDDFFPRSLTIFASHQWLGRDDPDPDKIQYRCICAALRDISSRGDRSLDEVYLWLDYASVPQSSRAVQRLMIMSLPCIAATVDVFLVVAPRAIHATTQQQCDVSTYHDRAWCRAEMFAHSSQRGVDVMYYGGAAADEAPGVRERRRGLPRDAHAPHADGIRRQGVVGPVGLGGHDAGRRGGAADSGEPGEQVAGLEEVTLVYTPVPLWFLPFGSFPILPTAIRRIHFTKQLLSTLRPCRILRRDGQRCCGIAR